MNEKSSFFSIATHRGFPFPVKCSCPTNSSRVFGRILDASGSIESFYAFRYLLTACTIRLDCYSVHMNTKSLAIGIVVIIVAVVGVYFVYKSVGSPAAPADTQTATTTTAQANQVQGQDVKVGTGAEAKPGDTVSILYVGKFTDGTVFDSSAAHGNQPLTFVLGDPGLIPGFQIGVNGMKEGGERNLAIPPSLGYGGEDFKDPTSGKVIIPANSTLIFQVQLVKVVPAAPVKAAQ